MRRPSALNLARVGVESSGALRGSERAENGFSCFLFCTIYTPTNLDLLFFSISSILTQVSPDFLNESQSQLDGDFFLFIASIRSTLRTYAKMVRSYANVLFPRNTPVGRGWGAGP